MMSVISSGCAPPNNVGIEMGTARARISNYVPRVRPVQHQSPPDMFIITLMWSLILRREKRKKFLIYASTVTLSCPHLWKQNSSEFAVMRSSFHLHCKKPTGRPGSAGCCASRCSGGFAIVSRARESAHKRTNWPWRQTHSISVSASFFFFTESTGAFQEHPVGSAVITKAAHLLNTCQWPFQLWTELTSKPRPLPHWETGRRRKWRHDVQWGGIYVKYFCRKTWSYPNSWTELSGKWPVIWTG